MGSYRYDVADLHDTVAGLWRLKSEYDGASRSRSNASSALGYSSLRGAMEEFVENWSYNRDRQLEEITETAKALGAIVDNYVKGDEAAAAELRKD